MRKENSNIKTKFISEPGSYLYNADYFAFVELNDYACYVIADGIDTDEKSASAQLAVTAVITEFTEDPGMSKKKMKRYINIAHQTLLEETKTERLECSIVIFITDYKCGRWIYAGNARLYMLRNGQIKFKTKDTSLSQKMIDEEELALDQLAYHEERHNLYTYLGQSGRFTPVLSKKRKMDDGDIFILMTRGVWENIGDAELLDAIEDVSDAEIVCTGLEDVILSQRLEVVENYTIASIFIDKVYKNPNAGKIKKTLRIALMIFMAVFGIVGALLFARYKSNKNNYANMMKLKERGVEFLNEMNYYEADGQFTDALTKADAIKAKDDSKEGKSAKLVENYKKLSGYLLEATDALAAQEYKKAANKYDSAISLCDQIAENYGENVDFKDNMEVYKNYAEAMRTGVAASEEQRYEDAIDAYLSASEIANSIDDIQNRNVADECLANTNSIKAMGEGDRYTEQAESLEEQGIFSKALIQYESAREAYVLAKEAYGNTDAESKIALMDIKIENMQSMISKQSDQDLEKEADGYVQMGNEAAHKGDYQEALKQYENAKEIYQKTGNNDQLIALNAKIEEATYGPDGNKAFNSLLDALTALAAGDTVAAKEALKQAADAYRNAGNIDSATQIQGVMNQIP